MRYDVYQGKPRTDKNAKKIAEFARLNDALDRMQQERLGNNSQNKKIDAYVVENPQ